MSDPMTDTVTSSVISPRMEAFSSIFARAADRKGGEKKLRKLVTKPLSAKKLKKIPDDRFLAQMTKSIFQSGFVWRVVTKKWPEFEEVFWGFAPEKLRLASDEQVEKMAQDERIIRNLTKVRTVRHNAAMVYRLGEEHGSFANFVADWPASDISGLWTYLKKHGARLGGNTGPYFLRFVGKDTFILSNDVLGYFKAQQLLSASPTSKKGLGEVQAAFNHWQQESGLSVSEISQIISMSVGDNHRQV